MKVEHTQYDDEIWGLKIVAEDGLDRKILEKFHNEGIKLNSIYASGDSVNAIEITFKGLIGRKKPPIIVDED